MDNLRSFLQSPNNLKNLRTISHLDDDDYSNEQEVIEANNICYIQHLNDYTVSIRWDILIKNTSHSIEIFHNQRLATLFQIYIDNLPTLKKIDNIDLITKTHNIKFDNIDDDDYVCQLKVYTSKDVSKFNYDLYIDHKKFNGKIVTKNVQDILSDLVTVTSSQQLKDEHTFIQEEIDN